MERGTDTREREREHICSLLVNHRSKRRHSENPIEFQLRKLSTEPNTERERESVKKGECLSCPLPFPFSLSSSLPSPIFHLSL
jgi:hypothetical protein